MNTMEQIMEENRQLDILVNKPVAERIAKREAKEEQERAEMLELEETRELIESKKRRAARDAQKAAQLKLVLLYGLYMVAVVVLIWAGRIAESAALIAPVIALGWQLLCCLLIIYLGVKMGSYLWRYLEK